MKRTLTSDKICKISNFIMKITMINSLGSVVFVVYDIFNLFSANSLGSFQQENNFCRCDDDIESNDKSIFGEEITLVCRFTSWTSIYYK